MKNHILKASLKLFIIAILIAFSPVMTEKVHAETPEEQALQFQEQYQQVLLLQAQYQQALQIQLLQANLLQAQYIQAQMLHTQGLQNAQVQAEQYMQYQMAMNAQIYHQANAIYQYNALKDARNIQLDNIYSLAHANKDNYIFGYTVDYRAELQKATEAYLRYWGLK